MSEPRTIGEVALQRRSVILDYLELTKPELTGLSVLTAVCGFYLASNNIELWKLLATAAGTLLVGGGAGALNQLLERDYDALMKRTERRPLPAGRLTPSQVGIFGTALSVLGILLLFVALNGLTALLGLATLISYLFVYTPSKRITEHATLVGAVPGAIPPVIGWTAASDHVSVGAWILFGILFLWQVPHFLSLAWMYRKDYARAGYRVLTVSDRFGINTGYQILIASVLLLPVSISATMLGLAGWMYAVGSVLLGLALVSVSVTFLNATTRERSLGLIPSNRSSRHVFFASLLYLPALMVLMTVDKI